MPLGMRSIGNAHPLLVGMQDGAATLENSLPVSYKIKHTLPMWSSNHTPWSLPKGAENVCPCTHLHADVYSSCIYNCQRLELTEISFSR